MSSCFCPLLPESHCFKNEEQLQALNLPLITKCLCSMLEWKIALPKVKFSLSLDLQHTVSVKLVPSGALLTSPSPMFPVITVCSIASTWLLWKLRHPHPPSQACVFKCTVKKKKNPEKIKVRENINNVTAAAAAPLLFAECEATTGCDDLTTVEKSSGCWIG